MHITWSATTGGGIGYAVEARDKVRRILIPRSDNLKHKVTQKSVEVLSFIGDIAVKDGSPVAHVHVVLGRANASALGGHLLEARVWPTLEVVLVQCPAYLQRVMNPGLGLPLIEPRK